ncbi:hypothetical protein, partial [Acinetobacter baumannii]|uniref:hypothetical protein n=1 Tax=Acinetobacter baumannii TaxID=470 RepID=UPI001C06C71D
FVRMKVVGVVVQQRDDILRKKLPGKAYIYVLNQITKFHFLVWNPFKTLATILCVSTLTISMACRQNK